MPLVVYIEIAFRYLFSPQKEGEKSQEEKSKKYWEGV